MSKIASTAAHEDSSRSRPSKLDSALTASAELFHPKRNPHSWFMFRLFLGFLGAALVLLPLALPESWIGSIFGLALFLTSILLPSTLKSHQVAEASPTPAARMALQGAEFIPEFAPPVPVELHVNETQILALKRNLQPAAVIPVAELTSVFLQRSEKSWLLFLHWSGKETAFAFHGHAAERHAKKAEAAIHNLGCFAPPEKPKARSASA
ncbi:MAG TPA: hypothetical protein VKD70_03545 [Candidatus Acidoferrum sp.]|nr:hypothetical protein [Candidatus Acidoferrum sp.]